jgi:hypothetical protein
MSDTQWSVASGLGGAARLGLRYSDVKALAEGLGIPWCELVIEKLRVCEDVILSQEAERSSKKSTENTNAQ